VTKFASYERSFAAFKREGLWDIDEFLKICWGCMIQSKAVDFRVAAGVLVALHSIAGMPVSVERAEVLVNRLQCDDMADPHRQYSDCCECDSDNMHIAQTAIQLLAANNPSIVESLMSLVRDNDASIHGRRNAADALSYIAFRQPCMRLGAIQAIETVLAEDSGFDKDERRMVLHSLLLLRAKEVKKSVRRVFKQGLIEPFMSGDYTDFLMYAGLPVNPNDRIVVESVENP